jgi:DNA-binding response OmpR family regulator
MGLAPVKNDNPAATIGDVKPRILVVEDEPAISEPLAENLEREGFDPVVAFTLEGARAELARGTPELILLDVMMPDGDGRTSRRRSGGTRRSRSSC